MAVSEEFDLLVRNGFVVDGTGLPRRRVDVGVRDGKVVRLAHLTGCTAREEIDAEGAIVAPGIVDAAHALRPADHVRSVRDRSRASTASPRCSPATAVSRSRPAEPRTATSCRASSPESRTWTRSRCLRSRGTSSRRSTSSSRAAEAGWGSTSPATSATPTCDVGSWARTPRRGRRRAGGRRDASTAGRGDGGGRGGSVVLGSTDSLRHRRSPRALAPRRSRRVAGARRRTGSLRSRHRRVPPSELHRRLGRIRQAAADRDLPPKRDAGDHPGSRGAQQGRCSRPRRGRRPWSSSTDANAQGASVFSMLIARPFDRPVVIGRDNHHYLSVFSWERMLKLPFDERMRAAQRRCSSRGAALRGGALQPRSIEGHHHPSSALGQRVRRSRRAAGAREAAVAIRRRHRRRARCRAG